MQARLRLPDGAVRRRSRPDWYEISLNTPTNDQSDLSFRNAYPRPQTIPEDFCLERPNSSPQDSPAQLVHVSETSPRVRSEDSSCEQRDFQARSSEHLPPSDLCDAAGYTPTNSDLLRSVCLTDRYMINRARIRALDYERDCVSIDDGLMDEMRQEISDAVGASSEGRGSRDKNVPLEDLKFVVDTVVAERGVSDRPEDCTRQHDGYIPRLQTGTYVASQGPTDFARKCTERSAQDDSDLVLDPCPEKASSGRAECGSTMRSPDFNIPSGSSDRGKCENGRMSGGFSDEGIYGADRRQFLGRKQPEHFSIETCVPLNPFDSSAPEPQSNLKGRISRRDVLATLDPPTPLQPSPQMCELYPNRTVRYSEHTITLDINNGLAEEKSRPWWLKYLVHANPLRNLLFLRAGFLLPLVFYLLVLTITHKDWRHIKIVTNEPLGDDLSSNEIGARELLTPLGTDLIGDEASGIASDVKRSLRPQTSNESDTSPPGNASASPGPSPISPDVTTVSWTYISLLRIERINEEKIKNKNKKIVLEYPEKIPDTCSEEKASSIGNLTELSPALPRSVKLSIFHLLHGPTFRDVDCLYLRTFRTAGKIMIVLLSLATVALGIEWLISVVHIISPSKFAEAQSAMEWAIRKEKRRRIKRSRHRRSETDPGTRTDPHMSPPFLLASATTAPTLEHNARVDSASDNSWAAIDLDVAEADNGRRSALWRRRWAQESVNFLGEPTNRRRRISEFLWWKPIEKVEGCLSGFRRRASRLWNRRSEDSFESRPTYNSSSGVWCSYFYMSVLEGSTTLLTSIQIILHMTALTIWNRFTAVPACINERSEPAICKMGRGFYVLLLVLAISLVHLYLHLNSLRICAKINHLQQKKTAVI